VDHEGLSDFEGAGLVAAGLDLAVCIVEGVARVVEEVL